MIKRALCLSFLVLGAVLYVAAQCPQIRIAPPDKAEDGMPSAFAAEAIGGDPAVKPTWNWSITAGDITSGQGTYLITVETSGFGGRSLSATVKAVGYPPACKVEATSPPVYIETLWTKRFAEYGMLSDAAEKEKLEKYAFTLRVEKRYQAYVIAYAGRNGSRDTAHAHLKTVHTYLTTAQNIPAERITTVVGGFRDEPATELWLVPKGRQQPNISPTVDPSQIRSSASNWNPIKK